MLRFIPQMHPPTSRQVIALSFSLIKTKYYTLGTVKYS